MLDTHPDVCCRGEGLFRQHLEAPLQAMLTERITALKAKNETLFRHTGGYPLPARTDADHLLGTAILLALRQQAVLKPSRIIGEKTPENVFLFPKLQQLFPTAKFIGVARDPRDVLTSAWHMFGGAKPGQDETAAKTEFITLALPSLDQGARTMIAFAQANPAACVVVTYEGLRADATPVLARLLLWLGVAADSELVRDCVTRTSFAALTAGRAPGLEQKGSFFRKGTVGDWAGTLTAEMNELVLQRLGWMFPYFGWTV